MSFIPAQSYNVNSPLPEEIEGTWWSFIDGWVLTPGRGSGVGARWCFWGKGASPEESVRRALSKENAARAEGFQWLPMVYMADDRLLRFGMPTT